MRSLGKTIITILSLSISACGPGKPSGPSQPTGPVSEADALAMMPSSANMLIGANIADLRGTELWAKYGGMLEKELYSDSDFKNFQQQCGFDPIKSVSQAWIGGRVDADNSIVAVFNGVPMKKLLECAAKDNSVTVSGNVITSKNGIAVGFPTTQTAVLASTSAMLTAALNKPNALAANTKFTSMRARLKSRDMWMVLLELPKGGANLPVRINAFYASGNARTGLAVDAGFVLDDEKQASMASGLLQVSMGQAKANAPAQLHSIIDKLKVTTEKEILGLSIALNLEEVGILAMVLTQM